jgi:hypothetical protein
LCHWPIHELASATAIAFVSNKPGTAAKSRSARPLPGGHPLRARARPRGRSAQPRRRRREGLGRALERRFNVTTDSNHDLPIAPNLLNREFSMDRPDKVWAGDITHPPDEDWLFLAVVIDRFCRQVIGLSLRFDMAGNIVIAASRAVGPRQRDSLLRRRSRLPG